MLLKNDLEWFSILHACPLQGPTMSCTLIACVALTVTWPNLSALLYWVFDVFALSCVTTEPPNQTQYYSIRRWSSAVFLPSDHLHLTSVHKDRLRPSQAPSTTIGPLQLWYYRVVQVTDYEWDPFFLYVSGSNPLLELPGSWSSIPYLYLAAFILFMHARKEVVCATRC